MHRTAAVGRSLHPYTVQSFTHYSHAHLLLGDRVDEGADELPQAPEHRGSAVQVQVAQALHVVVLEHVEHVLERVEVQVGGAKACRGEQQSSRHRHGSQRLASGGGVLATLI